MNKGKLYFISAMLIGLISTEAMAVNVPNRPNTPQVVGTSAQRIPDPDAEGNRNGGGITAECNYEIWFVHHAEYTNTSTPGYNYMVLAYTPSGYSPESGLNFTNNDNYNSVFNYLLNHISTPKCNIPFFANANCNTIRHWLHFTYPGHWPGDTLYDAIEPCN